MIERPIAAPNRIHRAGRCRRIGGRGELRHWSTPGLRPRRLRAIDQVGPALAGQALGFRPPPRRDPLVVAGEQHLGDRAALQFARRVYCGYSSSPPSKLSSASDAPRRARPAAAARRRRAAPSPPVRRPRARSRRSIPRQAAASITRSSTPSKRPPSRTARPRRQLAHQACVSGSPRGAKIDQRHACVCRARLIDRRRRTSAAHHHAGAAARRRVVDRAMPADAEVADVARRATRPPPAPARRATRRAAPGTSPGTASVPARATERGPRRSRRSPRRSCLAPVAAALRRINQASRHWRAAPQ